ncbi:MAG: Na(+)-translocating NADH-quinone reductase subunit C [Succinivibrionaceae bacterium]|nr:Na(+)-translocating NADH-quinone reductase subunit C [Succinivibrionaceae bacterium]
MLKLDKNSVPGTFVIITGFCLVCSVLVSSAVVVLDPFKAEAVANDRKVNILRVSGFEEQGKIADVYAKHIDARLIKVASGEFADQGLSKEEVDGYNFASLAKQPKTSEAIPSDQDVAGLRNRSTLMPVYFSHGDDGKVQRVILPFYGQALWSTAYGYMAVAPDGNSIQGITFYSHGETPGLGGEIDNPRWQALWVGKRFTDEQGAYKVRITKNPSQKDFDVDSLSGATLTSRGVDNAVHYWFGNAYRPFLDKLRKGEFDLDAAAKGESK